uniref:Uncharacterized protein n=1 Tax=Arundo donax TaxID=35708 RepID=A0A0A9A346_ARUDO
MDKIRKLIMKKFEQYVHEGVSWYN